jgi:activator of 2-hydroxyglutaryl-CoA dehydratase
MSDKNSPLICGEFQNLKVRQAEKVSSGGGQEVNSGFPSQHTADYALVEIFVRQEANLHGCFGATLRASSSFLKSAGFLSR